LAAAVALTAHGQDRPATGTADAKYYQGKVSPPPVGMFPTTAVKSGGAAKAWGPPPAAAGNPNNTPGMGVTFPPPPGMVLPPGGVPGVANKPRITQPVVVGGEGVMPATAVDPPPAPATVVAPPAGNTPSSPGMPPFFPAAQKPAGSALPPPTLTVEQGTPGVAPPTVQPEVQPAGGLPDPLPLNLGDNKPQVNPIRPGVPSVPAAPPRAMPQVTPQPPAKPAFTEQPPAPPAPAAALLPRQSPQVVVETEYKEKDGIGVGQPWVYDLVVRNVGTATVYGVRLDHDLPARAQFVGSEPTAETAGDRLSWSIGTLEPGVEKRVKVTVRPTEEGELRSRATVTFNTAVEARIKVTRPKLTLTAVGPDATRVGQKVPVQIKLTNTGSGPAGKLTLMARFSDGLTHPQGQVIEAELPGLKAGETKTLDLFVDAAKAGPQTCVLTAAADGNPAETARVSVTLVEPLLQIKQTGPAKCLVKGEPTYQIELSNPGTAATDPVQLWAQLPAGFEFVQATDGGQFLAGNGAVGWRLVGLPAGTTKTVSLKVRAVQPTDGSIRTVAISVADPAANGGIVPVEARSGGKPLALEARAETVVKAEGVPALRFDVTDIEDPVEVGKEAIYEIRVMNQGTGPCTNVQLVADLADGTSYVAAQGVTAGRPTGQQVVFEPIARFEVKGEAIYRVRVKGTAAGDQRFRVRLMCDQIRTPVVKEENTRFYKE
jgi:hypothetical protein